MGKIGIIANSRDIYDAALLSARNYVDLVTIVSTNDYKDSVRRAGDLAKDGVQVLIARGRHVPVIRQADIPLPVVEIPTFADELIKVLLTAYRACGKVAAIGGEDFIDNLKKYAFLVDDEIEYFVVREWADFSAHMATVKQRGYTGIIGGYDVARFAEPEGLRVFLTSTKKAEVDLALGEALKIVQQLDREGAHSQMLRTMLNSIHEGIVTVDLNGLITQINDTAVRLLGGGRLLRPGNLLPHKQLREKVRGILASGESVEDELLNCEPYRLIYSMRPIYEQNAIRQSVIVLQESEYVRSTERKLRHSAVQSGLVAIHRFYDILGDSPAITDTVRRARQFSQFNSSVLILGESGTGKELFAQSIHNQSPRRDQAFVAVNCATIPPNLLESVLFGYADGAFTGARRGGKIGLFELAHTGTVFLDEISEMPLSLQARLLRVLEERQIMRVGDSRVIPVNIRVIAASNKDLKQAVTEGTFRQDLYYRLNVLSLRLPPLRERKSDIPMLVQQFLSQLSADNGCAPVTMSGGGVAILEAYNWPGNIRELRNIVERLVVTASNGHIGRKDVYAVFDGERLVPPVPAGQDGHLLRETEWELISRVLAETGGNKSAAAQRLGISRPTLLKKLREMKTP